MPDLKEIVIVLIVRRNIGIYLFVIDVIFWIINPDVTFDPRFYHKDLYQIELASSSSTPKNKEVEGT
jgi:hypothetical protein